MRFVGLALVLALVSVSTTSCQETPAGPVDAEIDQSAPFCSPTQPCASGLSCTYEIFVGCGAKGECRNFSGLAEAGGCTAAMTLCGCDGKLVHVPACWDEFAPAPVLSSAQPTCSD